MLIHDDVTYADARELLGGATPATTPEPAGQRTVELRFAVAAAAFERLRASEPLSRAVHSATKTIRCVYFDTLSDDLWANGVTLWMRKAGRGWMMTLRWDETDDGPFERRDIEIQHAPAQPDLDLFDTATAERLRALVKSQPLEPRFSAQFKRSTSLLETGTAQVELRYDEGHIAADAERRPFCEVEAELKRGDPTAFYDLAARLTAVAPLRLELLDKGQRGHHLVGGRKPLPFKTPDFALEPLATLDTAIADIIGASLDHFVRNVPALDPTEPEAVHQARVALRRMRTALAQFNRALPCPEITTFRQQAKDLASALGDAREWDTFRDALETCAPAQQDDGFAALGAAAEARRQQAYASARTVVDGSQASRFVLTLQAFVLRRGWRNGLSAEELPRLTQPVAEFAVAEMQRLRKRVLKRGRGLLEAPPRERHDVRIALKNLRYAGEFFRTVLNGPRVAQQVRLAAKLQAALGTFNDAIGSVELTRSLEASLGPNAIRASGFVQGWFSRGAASGDDELASLWKRFRAAKPAWV